MSDATPSTPVIPTPHVLHFFLLLAALASLIFYFLSDNVVKDATDAAHTFGKDVPSIIAAAEIRKFLADADSSAVKVLMSSESDAPQSKERYDSNIAQVSERLVAAAQKITYGEEERGPILKIAQALPRYAAEVAQSHTPDPAVNAVHIRAAVKLAQNEIFPAADALDSANYRHLDEEYSTDKEGTATKCIEVAFAALLLLGILVGTQFSLLARFHRILNLPMVGATVLLLVMSVWLVYALCAAQGWLKIAKEDSFKTMHSLWKVRAVAFDADTDRALWLLDSANGADYEKEFKKKKNKLSDVEVSDTLITQLEREPHSRHTNGLLGEAIQKDAAFFSGEHATDVRMMTSYKSYMDIDAQIRDLETQGKHANAVALWASELEGDSAAGALKHFDKNLASALMINKEKFDEAVRQANDQFAAFGYFLPAGALTIVLLAWLGLRPRIREYA